MDPKSVQPPKVFISYSWTSTEHRERVRELVNRLCGDGVDVVLDIYDLREGQDKYAYMERMVSDSDISKVLVISDRKYSEKADAREGGVGTESIIISQDIYEKIEQRKFIPVVTEFDEQNKPYLPTFMKGRMYIDLSSEEKSAENYVALLRCIFDLQPYLKPAIGKPPSFLFEDGAVVTRSGSKLQMLKNAVLKNQPTVKGLTVDYLKSFQSGFDDFKLMPEDYEPRQSLIEKTKSSVQRFLPYRDEYLEFVLFVSQYTDDEAVYQSIFHFFEELSTYRNPPKGTYGYDSLTENFRFLSYELLLYSTAAFMKNEKFKMANIFLTQEYMERSGSADDVRYNGFEVFSYSDSATIEFENNQHGGGWKKLLRERATHEELSFRKLQETDLVLLLRSILHSSGYFLAWVPRTLMGEYHFSIFELFARGESHRYFEGIKSLLRVNSKEDFAAKLTTATEGQNYGGINLRSMNLPRMVNLESLDTRP